MANDHAGDDLRRIAPLPPVSSQPGGGFGAPVNGDGRMAAPFVGSPTMHISRAQPAAVYTPAPEEEEIPWAQGPLDETGEVEPVFEADVSETEAALAALSLASRGEEFPLDAFIIPEQTQRIPNGFEGKPLPEERPHTPVTDLADRLEKLSHRLRVEEAEAVVSRLAGGDKLDALLAGLLAGYIAGSK
jgi:hypothetical protein